MSEDTGSELPASGQWPKLAVKNFGPIDKGEVELRPLTVLAGPSNTGKSWLAMLIYAMTHHISTDYALRGFRPRIRVGRIGSDDNELGNFPENPAAWLQSLQEDKVLRLTDGDKQTLKSALEGEQESLKEEILRCFGLADADSLVREKSVGGVSVTFMNDTASSAFAIHRRLAITAKGSFSLVVDIATDEYRPPSEEHSWHILDLLLDSTIGNESNRDKLHYSMTELLDFLAYNQRYSSTHYLPADRGGVMHAHGVVVGALIQSASRPGLAHRSPLSTLSGVLADFLDQMLALSDRAPRRQPPRGPITAQATSLERNVLGGEIRVDRSKLGYPHFTYRPEGWKRDLSLMSVSSMVSELAPVALYLRHCVGEGDLLILEEPEAHLHPAMQVCLVREIAGWVRQGIRVLITTHSEWVLEEIANLVAAEEGEKEDGLKKQDVGMWLFESNDAQVPGSNIREIEWSVDEGGYDLDFDDVAIGLHNKWVNLVEEIE